MPSFEWLDSQPNRKISSSEGRVTVGDVMDDRHTLPSKEEVKPQGAALIPIDADFDLRDPSWHK